MVCSCASSSVMSYLHQDMWILTLPLDVRNIIMKIKFLNVLQHDLFLCRFQVDIRTLYYLKSHRTSWLNIWREEHKLSDILETINSMIYMAFVVGRSR